MTIQHSPLWQRNGDVASWIDENGRGEEKVGPGRGGMGEGARLSKANWLDFISFPNCELKNFQLNENVVRFGSMEI